jgi:glycosyltransferase involved in cell wall biosynthesis
MKEIKISVVIICKDAARTMEKTLQSAFSVTDDVVVVDSGSTDGTIEIIAKIPARLTRINWNGYGDAKNTGNKMALHNWIFSLDADEWIDAQLVQSLKNSDLSDDNTVFTMQRLNYLGIKPIHYGEWSNDVVVRLFNKQNAEWDTTSVHEKLIIKNEGRTVRLKGVLHHYTSPCIKDYRLKLKKYAALMANKYYSKGKKAYWYKMFFAPVVNFIQNYIIKAGFLDGREGLQIALAHASYTFEKYKLLKLKQAELQS